MKQPERKPDKVFYEKIDFWRENGVGLYRIPLGEKELTYARLQEDDFLSQEAEHSLFVALLKQI